MDIYGHLWTFVDIYKNDDILEEHLLLLDKKNIMNYEDIKGEEDE